MRCYFPAESLYFHWESPISRYIEHTARIELLSMRSSCRTKPAGASHIAGRWIGCRETAEYKNQTTVKYKDIWIRPPWNNRYLNAPYTSFICKNAKNNLIDHKMTKSKCLTWHQTFIKKPVIARTLDLESGRNTSTPMLWFVFLLHLFCQCMDLAKIRCFLYINFQQNPDFSLRRVL